MNEIPNHIAFIMDGNGRWAKKRLLPRKVGHKEGVNALKRVVKACSDAGVEATSFYAFSTENWSRPKDEVDSIFELIKNFADKELSDYVKDNYRVRIMGDIEALPTATKDALYKIIEVSKNNDGMIVNLGINYGARKELLHAINKLIGDGVKTVDESQLESALYTSGMNDPDVIVRSGGEQRLSNFMLWQSAYSELIFLEECWPDFDKSTITKILEIYKSRDRRFGKL